MRKAYINAAQIITVDTAGKNYKRGAGMKDIGILTGKDIIVEDGFIADFIPAGSPRSNIEQTIDVQNKIILPGLIDCHTHTVFAGSRASEFAEKLNGVSYEEIAEKGGGIRSTMNATKNATKEELLKSGRERVRYFISQGITSLEIKSGYGSDFETELKILDVIHTLKNEFAIDIIPTFLGAHTLPDEFKNNRLAYIALLTQKMLPHVAENKLAEFCDVFCEKTAFTAAEADAIFTAATKHGLRLKLHTPSNSIISADLKPQYGIKFRV